MTESATAGLRTLGPSDAIPNDLVAAYYLDDRKLRISIARVADRLYAFDDLCTCADAPCPLSGGLLTGTTLMCQCHGSHFDITDGSQVPGRVAARLRELLLGAGDRVLMRRRWGCLLPRSFVA